MTLDVGPEDELPDWAAAKEFYQKYDPKDVIGRGVSSVVRRCVHRATGHEFAVKIMEVTTERLSPEQLEEVREATRRETHILRQVAGHPHISEATFPAAPHNPLGVASLWVPTASCGSPPSPVTAAAP